MTAEDNRTDIPTRHSLRDLYEDYAAALDDQRLEDWAAFFAPDARYRAMARETFDLGLTHATIYCQGAEMVRDRAAAIRRTAVFGPRIQRRFVSGVRILSGDQRRITARANFLVTEAMFDAPTRLLLVGEYHDELVDTDAGWRFADRTAIYDNYRIDTTLVFPL